MSTSEELREEARLARENLVSTVGELGDTVQVAKAETISTAKRFAPFAWWRILVGGMGLGALAVLG